MNNDFKKNIKVKNQEDKMYSLIIKFYQSEDELTEEEKKEYLSIDGSKIRNNIIYTLWYMAKEFIEKGKVDEEIFKQVAEAKKKKVVVERIPEKWQRNPTEWDEEEKKIEGR